MSMTADNSSSQAELFADASLPRGLVYRPAFVAHDEESALLDVVAALPFREARFQQYTARRRVVGFGASPYTVSGDGLAQEALPPELRRLRRKVADWRGLDENQFAHALVTEYRTGTPIGWHRDQPAYGIVVGISLGSPCRMRFRPIGAHDERRRVSVLELEPRSAYAMDGDIRWCWQHSIAPTAGLRYSITFRTLRDPPEDAMPGR